VTFATMTTQQHPTAAERSQFALRSFRGIEVGLGQVGAALAAGYYIIPPFDFHVIAIRTDRDAPTQAASTSRRRFQQEPRKLPVGAGQFVDPFPQRKLIDTEIRKNAAGNDYPVEIFGNEEKWSANLELPVRAHKPTIIEATAKALGELIFDQIGIAPAAQSADPIIAGQILHWRKYYAPLTFFVAWWLDEQDL
jgi:hypothetical protein